MSTPLDNAAKLVEMTRACGADAADALLYEASSLSVSQRMGKPEGLERSESSGISLRAFVGKRSAQVSSSDTAEEALRSMAERAVAMARLAPEDPYSGLAPEECLATEVPDLDLFDGAPCEAEQLQRQCAEAEAVALGVKGISNSEGADASQGTTWFALATSNGFSRSYRTSHASLSVSVLAGEGTAMERDYDYSSARFMADLRSPQVIGQEAARRALARLNPRKVGTQRVPVIFDPRVSRRLLGNFISAVNGAAVARGTSFLKDSLRHPVFNEHIHIMDDPLRLRGLASKPFDGEGVKTQRTALVTDGVLQGWLLDVRSANKLGLKPAGHATRSMGAPPSPSASNVHIAAGVLTPGEMMHDIHEGFYVTELIGMGVNLVTGDYSQGASGFWIEDGKLAYPVSEVTIAGSLQEMFRTMIPASDLQFDYAMNAPTLSVGMMTVAGR